MPYPRLSFVFACLPGAGTAQAQAQVGVSADLGSREPGLVQWLGGDVAVEKARLADEAHCPDGFFTSSTKENPMKMRTVGWGAMALACLLAAGCKDRHEPIKPTAAAAPGTMFIDH